MLPTCCTDSPLWDRLLISSFFLLSLKYVSDVAFPATLKELALLENSFSHTHAHAHALTMTETLLYLIVVCVILIMWRHLHASLDVAATCTHASALTCGHAAQRWHAGYGVLVFTCVNVRFLLLPIQMSKIWGFLLSTPFLSLLLMPTDNIQPPSRSPLFISFIPPSTHLLPRCHCHKVM